MENVCLSRTIECDHLSRFDMHNWRPDESLSDDENYMDMVMLVTRNSKCRQGSMGCILVAAPADDDDGKKECVVSRSDKIYQALIGVSTNAPLFRSGDSDVHAEIGALGQASRRGNVTEGCTAYITMPPCKRCFGALLAAGVKRIVSRQAHSQALLDVAKILDIEMVHITQDAAKTQQARLTMLMKGEDDISSEQKLVEIIEQRKRRRIDKLMRKTESERKKKNSLTMQHTNLPTLSP